MTFKVGKGWHDNLVVDLDGKLVKLSDYDDFDGWLHVSENRAEVGREDSHSLYGRTSMGEMYRLDWDDNFRMDYKDTDIYSVTVTGAGNDFVRLSDEGGSANTSDGKDKIIGGSGRDAIHAGAGNDKIIAGNGIDYIWGDGGVNKIWGGGGRDFFYFEGYHDTKTVIKDYEEEDYITINRSIFDPSDVHLRDTKKGAVLTYEGITELEVLFEGAKAKSVILDFRFDD